MGRAGGPSSRSRSREPDRRTILKGLALAALAAPAALSVARASQLVISEHQRVAARAQAQRLYRSPSAIVGGNEAASLSVAEFFDYNCGVCRQLADGMFDLADSDSGIRLVFREFPIFGEDSEFAASAAIAARRQGRYVALHRALMRAPGRVGKHNVLTIAEDIGIDATQLTADMRRPEVRDSLRETRDLAEALAVPGTPTYVVDDIVIGGAPRDVLAALVDMVRTNRCNTCSSRL